MRYVFSILALISILGPSGLAQAQSHSEAASQFREFGFGSEAEMRNYFSISKIEVRETTPTPRRAQSLYNFTPGAKSEKSGGSIVSDVNDLLDIPQQIEKWVALGSKAWAFIEDNRPAANVTTQRVSILPADQPDWQQMEQWKGPVAKTYEITFLNYYGMKVVDHTYTIAYNYGGRYKGKGQYLANATVIPARTEVAPFFTFNSQVEIGQVVNAGTSANPIPGIELQLKYSVSSRLAHKEGRHSYFIRGDGGIVSVAGQNQ